MQHEKRNPERLPIKDGRMWSDMPIKITDITKSDSVNAVGNIIFTYNIVDAKGVVIASESSVISVNYNSADMKDIAASFIKDTETKEYEALQKVKADKFDVAALKAEVEKRILEKEVIK